MPPEVLDAQDDAPPARGELYPLQQLPARPFMPTPEGRRVSLATVYRDAARGLRTVKIAGQMFTTDAWAWAYYQSRGERRCLSHAGRPTPRQRARRHQAAERVLAAAGL